MAKKQVGWWDVVMEKQGYEPERCFSTIKVSEDERPCFIEFEEKDNFLGPVGEVLRRPAQKTETVSYQLPDGNWYTVPGPVASYLAGLEENICFPKSTITDRDIFKAAVRFVCTWQVDADVAVANARAIAAAVKEGGK